jgi:hypothetical protein
MIHRPLNNVQQAFLFLKFLLLHYAIYSFLSHNTFLNFLYALYLLENSNIFPKCVSYANRLVLVTKIVAFCGVTYLFGYNDDRIPPLHITLDFVSTALCVCSDVYPLACRLIFR